MKKFIAGFFLLAGLAAAAHADDQWVLVPGRTFENMLGDGGVLVMNSETLPWPPDGRPVLVTYLKTSQGVYRCINYEGESIQKSALGCYRLVK